MADHPFMQVDETLDLFNELQLQHHAVATKTKTLHDACDRLVCFFSRMFSKEYLVVGLMIVLQLCLCLQ